MREKRPVLDLSKLSDRIKFLRTKGPRGKLDQAVVAAAIGLSTNQYQRYEYGKARKPKIIEKLAAFYPCSLTWLLTNEGDPFPKAGIPEPSAGPAYIKEGGTAYATGAAQEINIDEAW
ncbi:MAG: helix-turn-helix transcriptional regulator, partial [Thermodesulfobacteriota bacterium]